MIALRNSITIRRNRPAGRRRAFLAGVVMALLAGRMCLAQPAEGTVAPAPTEGAPLTVKEALDKALSLVEDLEEEIKAAVAEDSEAVSQFERSQLAQQLIEYVLKQDPLNVTAGYAAGRMAILQGRPRDALPKLEAYVKDPVGQSDWYAHKLLGDLYVVSYPEHARGQYRQAVELAPREPEAIIGLAKAHLKLMRASDAIEHARTAIQFDREGNPEYQKVLAKALMLDQKYPQAKEAAKRAVELAEEKARAKPGNRGMLMRVEEQYGLLIDCLKKLVELYPDRMEYVIEYVHVYQDQADLKRLIRYHEALTTLERVREFGAAQPSVEYLYEEARLNRMVGKDARAVELLEQILQSNPNHEPARALLESIRPAALTPEGSASAGTP